MSDDKKIQVMELFGPTIQGEGIMSGTVTHFLRTGGCGLRCTWCDSLFSVLPEEIKKHRTMMTTDEILRAVAALPYAPYITFTGGDPAIQDRLGDLVLTLNDMGMRVAVETQGMYFPAWLRRCDVLTFSPKGPSSGNIVNPQDLIRFCVDRGPQRVMKICIKVVVFNEEDFEYAMALYELMPPWSYDAFYFTAGTPIWFGYPEDASEALRDQEETKRVLDVLQNQTALADMMLKSNTRFNEKTHLGCQQHVLLWPAEDKGV